MDDESPPPGYPICVTSASATLPSQPPPFCSLYTSTTEVIGSPKTAHSKSGHDPSTQLQQIPKLLPELNTGAKSRSALGTKGREVKKEQEREPPPAYSEGSSPFYFFTYLMAATGEAASIISQVQQGGAVPISSLGGPSQTLKNYQTSEAYIKPLDVGADEIITMSLR